ncbi:hypothetical protein OH76DRAFT_1488394 [Lentinus brumalis]|uniref:Uncharacterized protein n=1 Tax=Lentinus brumalis TaxID=2498619 RepID=A0A371CR54_9APHY|nr:hypothetical protein OH76DRAFT_1488394 [Polyporus brumalis]
MARLPTSPSAQDVIFARCCVRSLLNLRATSKACLQMVTDMLYRSLLTLCRRYMSKPTLFLRALTFHRAFIGGSVAVRFMTPESPFDCDTLDVFVPYDEERDFLRRLCRDQGAKISTIRYGTDDGEGWLREHALVSVTVLHTTVGTMRVHRSVAIDALAPLVCGWSSLHVTYVNAKHFGTAFPGLLFQHRGLVGDGIAGEVELVDRWLRRGYDLKMSARAWQEYRHPAPCAASRWVCHAQPRRLDDIAAMRVRMRPLEDRPLMSLVVWRLDSRPCGGRCLCGGDILQSWDKYGVL